MLDRSQPIQLFIVAGFLAAIAAAIIMARFLKKFVTGILAREFKANSFFN